MKRRWIVSAGAALLGAVALIAPIQTLLAGNSDDARAMVQRGIAALAKGNPRTARVELMNAIRADPDWADARVAQARVLLALGDGAGAKGELDRARTLGAPPRNTRHLMAHALLLSGEPEAALKEAQANDVIPQQAAYAARIAACAFQALSQIPQAAAAFDKSIALDSNDADTWIDLGRFHLSTGDRAAALVASDRAMALAPRRPAALTLRAELIRDQYGAKASLPWFEQALASDAHYLPALVEYAATLADMGQAQRMLSLTRRILALDPNNPRAYFMQSVLAARAGNMDLARQMLEKVGNRLDDQPATLLLRGVLHLDSGNARLAADQLASLVQWQPFNFQARLLYARALFQAGEFGEADATVTPLASRADADSYTLLLAGRVHEALGDAGAAQSLRARASRPDLGSSALLPLDPDLPSLAVAANADMRVAPTNISYVRVLLAQGDASVALSRATILRDANRGAPEAYVAVGDAQAEAGRWDQAARSYAAAANLSYSEGIALRLAAAWNRAGQTAQAEEALALYLEQNPDSIAANRLAATAWMRAGDWKRAAAALESVRAKLGNNDAYLLTDLAWAYLGLGDARQASVYAAHAYRMFPSSPVTSDAYGWMLFKARGRNQASLDLLEKAVALSPGNTVVRGHLATINAATRRKS
ncbi:hypothetical protein C1T17_09325 [Sphingobium sp. SCG-1]|uniref:tetratricopeptide repeat protein n=1 Tax=Sphingobium sp. SCG-1 TaxID=2072936 RepID=UPI000CD6A842|nr:tetratricopeptide repeat protein [Sphingobium sp. SCG-1]AUW58272.1 hypothetical protein C1T17_09325 [Sphingobium sp. SCG-1]